MKYQCSKCSLCSLRTKVGPASASASGLLGTNHMHNPLAFVLHPKIGQTWRFVIQAVITVNCRYSHRLGSRPNSWTLSSKVTTYHGTLAEKHSDPQKMRHWRHWNKNQRKACVLESASSMKLLVSFQPCAAGRNRIETYTPILWPMGKMSGSSHPIIPWSHHPSLKVLPTWSRDVVIHRGQGAVGPSDLASAERGQALQVPVQASKPLCCSCASPQTPEGWWPRRPNSSAFFRKRWSHWPSLTLLLVSEQQENPGESGSLSI